MQTLTCTVLFDTGLLVGRRPDGRPVRHLDRRSGDDVDAVALELTDLNELADVLGAVTGDLARCGAGDRLLMLNYDTEAMVRQAADTFRVQALHPKDDLARRYLELLLEDLRLAGEMAGDEPLTPPADWPPVDVVKLILAGALELCQRAARAALTGDGADRWLPIDPATWEAGAAAAF